MNKHAAFSRIVTLIGSGIYMMWAAILVIGGMVAPLHITINDRETVAYLWEFAKYPGPLSFWAMFILGFVILAAVGIICSKKVKKKATTGQGVTLIIIGVATIFLMAGIFYLIGGIQTLLARDEDANNQTAINNEA